MSTTQTHFNLNNVDANAFWSVPQDESSNPRGILGTSTDNAAKDAGEMMFKTQQCRTYTTKGKCPYEYMCMYAHGPGELRTKEMNISDGLTTAAQIRTYQQQLKASGYSTRHKNPSPDALSLLSGFGSPASPFSAFSPTSPFGLGQSAGAFSPMGSLPSSPLSRSRVIDATSPLAGSAGPFPWTKQSTPASSPSMHMKGCDCRECRVATAQAAQAQALACPCPECIGAAAAAVAAIPACRLVAARKAQAQAQMCPCPECIGAAQAALTASATHPCPCPDCAPRSWNDGSSMGAPTSGMSTSSTTSPVSRLSSRDYMPAQ